MLLTYLEETRRQPEEVRKRRAMIITIAITGAIVCFYLLTIYFKTVGTRPQEEQRTQAETTTESVFNASNAFLQDADMSQGNGNPFGQTASPENANKGNNSLFSF